MLRGSGRSGRGQVEETDPRFLKQGAMGVVKSTNHGGNAQLLRANPDAPQKLIYASDPEGRSWTVAVSSDFPNVSVAAFISGVLCRGRIGSGGSTVPVEFDCKPDQIVSFAAPIIDLDVMWSPRFELIAGNVVRVRFPVGAEVPETLNVRAVAAKGAIASRGMASRTMLLDCQVAGTFILDIPPFSDKLWVFLPADAAYANITLLTFLVNGAASPMVVYTGAQILALKNAGVALPVPGMASRVLITFGAAQTPNYLSYELSL